MKKIIAIGLAVAMVLTLSVGVALAKPGQGNSPSSNCTTIQDGLLDSAGNPLVLGYDQFGYNYQAHIFNGRYCDYDRVTGGEYCDVQLVMKWNDAWLSNKDCDDDGKLDRHYGHDDYIGSGAWCTNHQSGSYEEDGKTYKWNYFVKIVAVPEDAYVDGVYWYTTDDTQIGSVIWGSFARIQQVYNDQGTGDHGIEYLSPAGPGFGKW